MLTALMLPFSNVEREGESLRAGERVVQIARYPPSAITIEPVT
jgi:hypothetical protein